jgi:hypothetical protein
MHNHVSVVLCFKHLVFGIIWSVLAYSIWYHSIVGSLASRGGQLGMIDKICLSLVLLGCFNLCKCSGEGQVKCPN